jgi:hypothetical protein
MVINTRKCITKCYSINLLKEKGETKVNAVLVILHQIPIASLLLTLFETDITNMLELDAVVYNGTSITYGTCASSLWTNIILYAILITIFHRRSTYTLHPTVLRDINLHRCPQTTERKPFITNIHKFRTSNHGYCGNNGNKIETKNEVTYEIIASRAFRSQSTPRWIVYNIIYPQGRDRHDSERQSYKRRDINLEVTPLA